MNTFNYVISGKEYDIVNYINHLGQELNLLCLDWGNKYTDRLEGIFMPRTDSSMLMEPFTLGQTEPDGIWISSYNREYDALVDIPEKGTYLLLEDVRSTMLWQYKPLFIVLDEDIDTIKNIYKEEVKYIMV